MCLTFHSFFMSLISISVPFTCWKRFHRGTPSIFRNNDSKTPPFCRPLQQPSQTTFPSKKPSHFTFPPWLIYSRIKKYEVIRHYLSSAYPYLFDTSKFQSNFILGIHHTYRNFFYLSSYFFSIILLREFIHINVK